VVDELLDGDRACSHDERQVVRRRRVLEVRLDVTQHRLGCHGIAETLAAPVGRIDSEA
jgi:hypothetical protein